MLSLNDPKWRELRANYTDGARVAELLSIARTTSQVDDWYEDLFQELCHQYTVSEAAFAALPHLVAIAQEREDARLDVLILAASCYAFSRLPGAESISPAFEEEWHAAAKNAVPLMASLLQSRQTSELDMRYLLFSVASFHGYFSLAATIEALGSEVECPHCGTLFYPWEIDTSQGSIDDRLV